MNPTQAQIEAAAAEIEKYRGLNQTAKTLAIAALTAASAAGKQNNRMDRAKDRFNKLGWRDSEIEQVRAATIERCAKVAEAPKDIYGIGAEIAAAIRALKDA